MDLSFIENGFSLLELNCLNILDYDLYYNLLKEKKEKENEEAEQQRKAQRNSMPSMPKH